MIPAESFRVSITSSGRISSLNDGVWGLQDFVDFEGLPYDTVACTGQTTLGLIRTNGQALQNW